MANIDVILFLGSPRDNGYSTALAREVGKGATKKGLSVKEYSLNDKNIRGCQGCYYCRGNYGCSVNDYLTPMYADIAAAKAVVVASPIYFYRVTGQTKLWVDRMFPMIDSEFHPRQPGKKAITIISQHQPDPRMFKVGIDWLNGVLEVFGWNVTASLICCDEPEEDSHEYQTLLKKARAAGNALTQD